MDVKIIPLILLLLNGLFFLQCDDAKLKKVQKQTSEIDNKEKLERVFASVKFNPQKSYEKISLQNKGKPFIRLGQKIELLDESLSFQRDANGLYSEKSDLIVDYYSTDNDLSVLTKEGSINGILFFSADRMKGEIFNIAGSWAIDVDLKDEKSKLEVEKMVIEKLFPVLKDEFEVKSNWSYTNEKATLLEHFKLSQSNTSQAYWKLSYAVEPKLSVSN